MKQLSVFWGCTIPARFPFVEKATRLVLADLGAKIVDLGGFTCCPETTLVRAADEEAYYLTAARNLAVAEQADLPLLTPCNGCYSTFKSVLADLKKDWRLKRRLNEMLADHGLTLRGDIEVWHLVEWMSEDLGPAAIAKIVIKPLWGMRIAVHYGCHMLRPTPAIRWDSAVNPTKFEQLVSALGATVVDYETRMDCCGGAFDRVGERQKALAMCRRKVENVLQQGADALVVSCPSCFQQFDLNQAALLRETGAQGLPVFYLTELVALALGREVEELGLEMHRVSAAAFVTKWRRKLEQRETMLRLFNLSELQICAECRACDTDCPAGRVDEGFVPSRLINRLLTEGIEAVLEGPDIWQCLDCMTCYERCHSRLGMAVVFERLKRIAQEQGRAPAATVSSYQAFRSSGVLGAGRPAARQKLGLPDLPPNGADDLRSLLSEKEGKE
ncbi:MAG: heterodisulfide reductase-related iron-sulfur binding cluster [Actinobacteria bacterium]|nr:heterodisulfide reductase-related iron-sulfur binding cluster [Actinomycetota bacterium]